MKNALPCIFILLVAFIAGCKKETKDLWADTTFAVVWNFSLKVNSNNDIVEYTKQNDQGGNYERVVFTYYNDTLAEKNTFDETGFKKEKTTYFLNADGYADSTNTITYSLTDSTLATCSYTYYSNGYLQHTNHPYRGFTYDSLGNVSNQAPPSLIMEYVYADTLSKLDLFIPQFRGLDNKLTGKNDNRLIKNENYRTPDFNHTCYTDKTYYYNLDNAGYVTRCVVFESYYGALSCGSSYKTYTKYNFTYEFIQ